MGSSELMYFIIVFSPLIFINLQESRTFWWKILMHMIYKKQLAHVFNPVLGRQKCADSVSLRTVRSHSSRLARLGLSVQPWLSCGTRSVEHACLALIDPLASGGIKGKHHHAQLDPISKKRKKQSCCYMGSQVEGRKKSLSYSGVHIWRLNSEEADRKWRESGATHQQ